MPEPKVKLKVEHPGVLEVPEGKKVYDLPLSHFKELVRRKTLSTVSRALTNLIVWNKKKNPSISKRIDNIQNQLTRWANQERETKDKTKKTNEMMIDLKESLEEESK